MRASGRGRPAGPGPLCARVRRHLPRLPARHHRPRDRPMTRVLALALALVAASCGVETIQLRPDAEVPVDASVPPDAADAARPACVCRRACVDVRGCLDIAPYVCEAATGVCEEAVLPAACTTTADCTGGRGCVLES